LCRDVGDATGTTIALEQLAVAALLAGDDAAASDAAAESLALGRTLVHRRSAAQCLEVLAAVAARAGRFEEAGVLAGATDALREGVAASPTPLERRARAITESLVAAGAGADALGRWLADGRRRSRDDVDRLASARRSRVDGAGARAAEDVALQRDVDGDRR
jgi:hypothetical protein